MNKKRIFVIAASHFETEHIETFLKKNNKFEIYTRYLFPKGKKGQISRGFLLKVCQFINAIIFSKYFFSFHHGILERNIGKFNLKSVSIVIIYKLLRKFHNRNFYLTKCCIILETIFANINKRELKLLNKENIQRSDIFIFCGLMGTDFEMKYFVYASELKCKTFYLTPNWDNPTSKTYFPQKFSFTKILCWGDQMRKHLKKCFPEESLELCYHPKLEWTNKISKRKKNDQINIVYFDSQKPNKRFIYEINEWKNFDKNIFKKNSIKKYNLIYRPHPSSHIFQDRIKIIENIFTIDKATTKFIKKDLKNLSPIQDLEFRNDSWNWFQEIFSQNTIVIAPAGSVCLEAALCDVTSIAILSDPYQVTQKLFNHFDHLKDFLGEEFVIPIFSEEKIFSSLERLIKYQFSKNKTQPSTAAKYYVTENNLFQIIENNS